ncbi:MAG: zf-HC2 domain-containing protein [Armatimonadota bacterium]|nr:zf-HC2 domain-containing protein [Armatimonadota bacterium]
MRCTEVRARLAEYQLGALDEAESAAVERHLQSCPECRAELEALERLDALLEPMERVEAPAGLWAEVQARMAPRQRGVWRSLAQWWRQSPRPALAAAAALVLAVGGLWLALRSPASAPTASTLASEYQEQQIVAQWSQPLADDAALGMMFASLNGAEVQ